MTDAAYIEDRCAPDLNSGCWIWSLAWFRNGYGAVSNRGERLAHRLSWRTFRGPIPEGSFVCHKCDTPACVNPDHLFLGSHSANMQDMANKGRHWLVKDPRLSPWSGNAIPRPAGERAHRASMSNETAVILRRRYASGERIADLAQEFGLSYKATYKAASGRSYKCTIE